MMNIYKLIAEGPSRPFADALWKDLSKMEDTLAALCGPEAGCLSAGLRRVVCSGGKRLRPLLAWTSWRLAGGRMEIVPLMTMLELMHTTSLIHDDFVDGARLRRGVATINAEQGGDAALRSGDHLLARAMEYLKLYRGTGINEALSEVAQEMCLGELDQHAGLFRLDGMDEGRYFSRIRRKTALLMAECCRSGAVAGGAGSGLAAALLDYGLHLGLAFQLRDDLLDFEPSGETGKPALQDLHSGVITLPVILAAQSGTDLIPYVEKRDKTAGDIETILHCIKKTKALETTRSVLQRECGAAAGALSSLPMTAEKKSLLLLAESLSEVKHIG